MCNGTASVSFPVTFVNGHLFKLLYLRHGDGEESTCFFEAYSNVCCEKEVKYAVDMNSDNVLVPVHEACMNLYKQRVRGSLPVSSRSVEQICAEGLERLAADYEEVLSFDPDVSLAYDMCERADSLNGHYGALSLFQWVTGAQLDFDNGEDGFVYHGCCSNRVCYDPSSCDLTDAETRFSTWIPST